MKPFARLSGASTLLAVLAALLVLPSCTAVSRGLGKMTANKFASPRSGSLWVVAPPMLSPPAPDQKTVYIAYQNISDAEIELAQLLRDAAVQQGWTVVSDPTTAQFRLLARTRFFGEVAPETGGADVARTMGLISGAAVGLGTGIAVDNASDSTAGGIAAGAAAGGLVGVGISNASTPREWALVVDFVLEEYNESEVEFQLSTDNRTSGTSGAAVGNSRMGEGSANTTGNSSSATVSKSSNYYPHGVRLSVWANQMNMRENEAMPLIVEKAENVVTRLLP